MCLLKFHCVVITVIKRCLQDVLVPNGITTNDDIQLKNRFISIMSSLHGTNCKLVVILQQYIFCSIKCLKTGFITPLTLSRYLLILQAFPRDFFQYFEVEYIFLRHSSILTHVPWNAIGIHVSGFKNTRYCFKIQTEVILTKKLFNHISLNMKNRFMV